MMRVRWPSFGSRIFLGLLAGILIGVLNPALGDRLVFLQVIFLNLIRSAIAPLVFATIVVGVAGGSPRRVGRLGLKAFIYFEVVTTIALVVGLVVVNITRPGHGIVLSLTDAVPAGLVGQLGARPKGLLETFVRAFPSSIVAAMREGDILQIVIFAFLFALALSCAGERVRPVLTLCESLASVMFRFTGLVMQFAPFGVAGAMAHTVAHQGVRVLTHLGALIASLYLALALFVLLVLLPLLALARIPLRPFLLAVREACTIAFVTASSGSVLPDAMQELEHLGASRSVVSFAMPTGYSFNMAGTCLYLAVAGVFVTQAAEPLLHHHFTLGEQVWMMVTMMITSNGVAAIPRTAPVILLASLGAVLPESVAAAGVALVFGVDDLMDMGRSFMNVFGNCLATVVIARWEGEFDDERARNYQPHRPTSDEATPG